MNRRSLSPLIVFCLMGMLLLAACGGAPAAATEAPAAEAPAELPPEEPPVEEPPPAQGGQFTPLPVLIAPTLQPLNQNPLVPSLPPTLQPALPERRRLTLEFPPQIREGDSDRVRLTLEVDELGNLTPTAEVAGNIITGEVIEIPNLYETHRVIAEAQFDIAGLQVSPPGRSSQPLAQGQSVTFYWSILPEGTGIYRGTIWLYVRFVEIVSGEESEKAVSAQTVEIEAVNFLGLSVSLARSFGVVGSLLGTVLGFPFLEDIVKFLFKRRRIN